MKHYTPSRKSCGFTLIELMVALVLGLIVIGAVLALSLSMIRANTDTIRSTRLTQELRATAAAITSELKRAGSVANPFDLAAANAMGGVDTPTPDCIRYSYSYNDGAGLQTVNRAISRSGDAIYVGSICGAGGVKLSSDVVDMSPPEGELRFVYSMSDRSVSVTLRGKMKGANISRMYSQTVFAPSLVTGT